MKQKSYRVSEGVRLCPPSPSMLNRSDCELDSLWAAELFDLLFRQVNGHRAVSFVFFEPPSARRLLLFYEYYFHLCFPLSLLIHSKC